MYKSKAVYQISQTSKQKKKKHDQAWENKLALKTTCFQKINTNNALEELGWPNNSSQTRKFLFCPETQRFKQTS